MCCKKNPISLILDIIAVFIAIYALWAHQLDLLIYVVIIALISYMIKNLFNTKPEKITTKGRKKRR